jgi:hypothetical protein
MFFVLRRSSMFIAHVFNRLISLRRSDISIGANETWRSEGAPLFRGFSPINMWLLREQGTTSYAPCLDR